MNASVNHEHYGRIEYSESFWTGKKALSINGTQLSRADKRTFVMSTEDGIKSFYLTGSYLTGVNLAIDNEIVSLVAPPRWYEIVCSVIVVALVLVWGNSAALCSIIPIVGGAIGGAIGGAMAVINLFLMKKQRNVGIKLAVWLGMLVGAFLMCFAVAAILVGAVVGAMA